MPFQQAANYVTETVKGTDATAEKEVNKNVAQSSEAGLGTRAQAAKDAAVNKVDEKKHDTKADVHKGKPRAL